MLLAGLFGTTVMTTFSYALSYLEKKNFKEPELLGLLIQRLPHNDSGKPNFLVGWALHYLLGCAWAAVYAEGLHMLRQKPTNKRALLFGLCGGAFGIITWKSLFKQHPNPPRLSYASFYRQLFVAQVLFAVSASKAMAFLHEKASPEKALG